MLVWRAGFLKDKGRPNTTGDLDRQAARHRGRGGVLEHRDPGARRRRLRRRPPRRALLPRRARHDPLRGDLADPETDHRARVDRASTRWCPPERRRAPTRDEVRRPTCELARTIRRRRSTRAVSACGAGTMGAGIAQLACRAGARTLLHDPIPEALERGAERVRGGPGEGSREGSHLSRGGAGGGGAAGGGRRAWRRWPRASS